MGPAKLYSYSVHPPGSSLDPSHPPFAWLLSQTKAGVIQIQLQQVARHKVRSHVTQVSAFGRHYPPLSFLHCLVQALEQVPLASIYFARLSCFPGPCR
ncbi:hypothetical protein BV22DRAFT_216401 [Leucogyrophana mollusca]|uniref:Uncharacterized protein n=1 Tax=Leucogyrophana mollusca TaxID=85980 RepID=A0ACB8BSH5_9AGAM|nr:hypothetical protein BV22DRAFT_216401 [Leucogyrophana mollusca]